MAKQTPQKKNFNTALVFTAVMGIVVGLFTILIEKSSETNTTLELLRNMAVAGTMVGGVAMGLLYYGSNNK
jgi:uncharacterized membrane-anchored protein